MHPSEPHRTDQRSMREAFYSIYTENRWSGRESVSGHGSDLDKTAALRRELPGLIAAFNIATILDAPCGDFHWMSQVELNVERYIGLDIVPDIVSHNAKRFGNAARTFAVADITRDALPRVDLILCRDCLVHLPHHDVASVISAFCSSGSRYLLTTTFPGVEENDDVLVGAWRPLNLQAHPFAFPEPMQFIDEQTDLTGEEVPGSKCLALWDLSAIEPASIERRLQDACFTLYEPPWRRRVNQVISTLGEAVPAGQQLVLVDDELLPDDAINRHSVTRFFERDGQYWGRPEDSASAVSELERLRRCGAGFIAFVYSSFWWLDYYAEFAERLRTRYACVAENDHVIVFDLRAEVSQP